MTDAQATYKQKAAEHAAGFVRNGMIVGLGTGSTAIFATRRIADLLNEKILRDVVGFATSIAVWKEAEALGIPMLGEDMPKAIDLTIDGADEVDPDFNVIKGGGAAMLREKIVAQASAREIIVVDESKLSPQLGTHWPVPVEVLPYGWRSQARYLASIGAEVALRRGPDAAPVHTDQGNLILDCKFGPIADPAKLAATLSGRAGVMGHGLFLGLVHDVIVAGSGGVRHLRRGSGPAAHHSGR
jgi:ribose 5-phosphate isomerase A